MYETRVLQAADFLRSDNRREISCLITPKVGEGSRVRGWSHGQSHMSPSPQCLGSSIRAIERKTQGYGPQSDWHTCWGRFCVMNGSRARKAHFVPLRERKITAGFGRRSEYEPPKAGGFPGSTLVLNATRLVVHARQRRKSGRLRRFWGSDAVP